MFDQFENTYLKVVRGEQTGFLASLFKCLLHPLSWLYSLGSFTRNKAYDFNLLKSYSPAIPAIVSIGNITAGGTGKTPITQLLAQAMTPHYKVAILSRGYRSTAEHSNNPVVLKAGKAIPISHKFCGDEPYMLCKNTPDATIYIGKNRCASASKAADDGIQLAILDDGMQHRKLARDFELVVVDGTDPFGQGHPLPRGLLREGITSLKRADLIIVNHIQEAHQFHTIRQQIDRYSKAPVIAARIVVNSIRNLEGSLIPSLQGKKVALFCAIGSPHHFAKTIKSLGATIVDQLIIPDHGTINEEILAGFAEECRQKGAEFLVCTEKDQVKLEGPMKSPLPIIWTKISLEFIEGSKYWDDLIQKITNKINNSTPLNHPHKKQIAQSSSFGRDQ